MPLPLEIREVKGVYRVSHKRTKYGLCDESDARWCYFFCYCHESLSVPFLFHYFDQREQIRLVAAKKGLVKGENGEKLRLPGYNSVAGFGDPTYFMLSKLHPFFDRILIPGGDWEALEYSIPSSYVKSCLKILEIFNSHVSKVELVLKVTADLGLDPSKIYLGDLVEQLDLLNNWGLLNNDSE